MPMPPPKPTTEGRRDRQVFHEMGQLVRAVEANGPSDPEGCASSSGAAYWEAGRFESRPRVRRRRRALVRGPGGELQSLRLRSATQHGKHAHGAGSFPRHVRISSWSTSDLRAPQRLHGERQRQHVGRTGGPQRPGGEGERPPGDDEVVDEQDRPRPSRAPGSASSAKRRPTAATRWAEFIAPWPGAHVGVDDRPAARRRAPAGSARGRRRGRRSAWAGSTDSTTTIPSTRGPPVAEHLDHRPRPAGPGPGRPRCRRGTSARSAWPWPRSVSRATARPSARRPSAILPLRSTPRLASAVGHILRGSRATPGRESRAAASSSAASETVGRRGSGRRSCRSGRTRRPRGRRAGRAGTTSGTGRCAR